MGQLVEQLHQKQHHFPLIWLDQIADCNVGLNTHLLQTLHDFIRIELLLLHRAAGRLEQRQVLIAALPGVVLDGCSDHVQVQKAVVEVVDVLQVVVHDFVQILVPEHDRSFLIRKYVAPLQVMIRHLLFVSRNPWESTQSFRNAA